MVFEEWIQYHQNETSDAACCHRTDKLELSIKYKEIFFSFTFPN